MNPQCDFRNLSEPCRLPRPITGIAALFLYANDIRTWQETHLWVSTVFCRDYFVIQFYLLSVLVLSATCFLIEILGNPELYYN
jgi:hypothetical protein